MGTVPRVIPLQFLNPIFLIRAWHSRLTTSGMPVPEATMDHYNTSALGKDKIRLPGKVLQMQPVTVAETVQQPTDRHFRRGVSATDSAHILGSAFGG